MRADGAPPAGAGGAPSARRGMLPATGSGVTYLHALRVAAVVLVLFGLLGFALLWAGVSAVSAVAADVGALQRSLDEQRRALATALQDTSRTVGDGSTAFTSFERGLDQAARSAHDAAQLSASAALTLGETGRQMRQLTFLGTQPLAPVGEDFSRASEQLVALSGNLSALELALTASQRDVQRTGTSLVALRARLDELSRGVAASPAVGGPSVGALRLLGAALAVWLAGQAALCVLFGALLFAYAQRQLRLAESEPVMVEPSEDTLARR